MKLAFGELEGSSLRSKSARLLCPVCPRPSRPDPGPATLPRTESVQMAQELQKRLRGAGFKTARKYIDKHETVEIAKELLRHYLNSGSSPDHGSGAATLDKDR